MGALRDVSWLGAGNRCSSGRSVVIGTRMGRATILSRPTETIERETHVARASQPGFADAREHPRIAGSKRPRTAREQPSDPSSVLVAGVLVAPVQRSSWTRFSAPWIRHALTSLQSVRTFAAPRSSCAVVGSGVKYDRRLADEAGRE